MSDRQDEWFEADTARYLANRQRLIDAHAYSPGDERYNLCSRACGHGALFA